MSLSNRGTIGIAVVLLAVLLAIAGTLRQPSSEPEHLREEQPMPRILTADPENNRGRARPRASVRATPVRRGVRKTSPTVQNSTDLPLLEGYLVDDFRGWAELPSGYYAENLEVRAGAVRIPAVTDAHASAPASAMLESPPLPLRRPSLQAPARNSRPPDDTSEVQLQLRLSTDGSSWTPWEPAERYRRPDGSLVLPLPVPTLGSLLPPELSPAEKEAQSSAPLIRYRLTITSRSPEELVIRDVRLWKKHRI